MNNLLRAGRPFEPFQFSKELSTEYIPSGNGVVLTEQVVPVRGPVPTATGRVMPPDNGVFIDIQSIAKGMPIVEIKQGIRVEQGRVQIDTGPNQIIKDAGAGTISFIEGPQKRKVLP